MINALLQEDILIDEQKSLKPFEDLIKDKKVKVDFRRNE
jgi:hypothetical protein